MDNTDSHTEGNWVAVAHIDQFDNRDAIEVVINDRPESLILAIVRHQDQWYAIDGMCSHQGGPLAEGFVEHGCITCPWHGWQYELETGIQTINRQPLQQRFDVREVDGRIEVKLD